MPPVPLKHALAWVSFAIAGNAVAAETAQPILSCDTHKTERAAMKHAAGTVRRVNKHVLEVMSKSGPQRFADKPPYDVELDGLRWRYCGYHAPAKAHLIEKADGGTFSGELLLEESGQRMRAGHTVFFSPDMHRFLAVEQENGRDGEDWTVKDVTGKILWQGYAGTLAKVDSDSTMVSMFEDPRWTAQGDLTARFTCLASEAQGKLTLSRSASGKWGWSGHAKCG